MAYPSVAETFALLGYLGRDKITGAEGVVISVCFDLYGCVQVTLDHGLDKDSKRRDSFWYDVARIELRSKTRVMEPPDFGTTPPQTYNQGSANKPPARV